MGDQRTHPRNAARGVTLVGQDIYEESATAKCALGTRLHLGDRVFRYCKNGGTALVAGKLIQAPPIDTYDEDIVVPTSSPAGSRTVYLTNPASHAAIAADQYKDGYLTIGSGTGSLGKMYKIKSNTAAAAGALLTLTLYDELVSAITAGTHTGHLVASPFYNCVLDAATGLVFGVPLIDVTANYYFWAQTWGHAPIIATGAIVKGQRVVANGDGTVAPVSGTANEVVKPIIGISAGTYDTGDAGPIYLQLMP